MLRQPPDISNVELWFEKRWGKDAVERLKATDIETLLQEAETLFTRALDQYSDVAAYGLKQDDEPLSREAGQELHELRDLAVGKVAPEIIGEDVAGTPFRLSDYRGQVVLLTFSANWCGHCRAMYPRKRALLERYKDKPLVILSVDADDERETLTKLIDEGEITWRCWWDGPDSPIHKEWSASVLPRTYVLDAAGVIRHKNVRGRGIDEAVESLMKET